MFNTLVPQCGTRFYPVAGAGAGFIVGASLAARAASNERRRSEEEARNERTSPSAVSRCPQPLPSAVAVSQAGRWRLGGRWQVVAAGGGAFSARRQGAGGGGLGLRCGGLGFGGQAVAAGVPKRRRLGVLCG